MWAGFRCGCFSQHLLTVCLGLLQSLHFVGLDFFAATNAYKDSLDALFVEFLQVFKNWQIAYSRVKAALLSLLNAS